MITLKLKNYQHKKMLFRDFIYNFLVNYNFQYETQYIDGRIQCYKCKSRSLGDIYSISKYYFPEVTLEETKECLLSFGKNLVGHFCTTIGKRIYEHKDYYNTWHAQDSGIKDEYNEIISYNETSTNYRLPSEI